MKFFEELKRRNVIKETLAYLVVSWVLIQIATTILPIVDAPAWVLKTGIFLLALGLPVWIFFSWAYEVTTEGFKKTAKVSKDLSGATVSNVRFNYIIIIALITAIVASFFNRSVPISNSSNLISNKSIAVLPFEDLSSGGDTEWFCDGVTEDIRSNLSKIKGIEKVISYTSVMQYKENRPTIPEIAKKLGVSYILEGSVRKQDNQIIISAQLIDAHSDTQLWGDNYIRDLTDVFAIQTEIAESVAKELGAKITPDEQSNIESVPTSNIEAYDFYLKANDFYLKGVDYNQRSLQKENFSYAIQMFEQAIAIDSNYALAWIGLTQAYSDMYWYNYEGNIDYKLKIKECLDKAIALNPELLEVKIIEGLYYYRCSLDYPKAIEIFEKLKSKHPNNSELYAWSGYVYRRMGQFEKYIENIDKYISMNPTVWGAYFAKGETLIMLRKYKEAEYYLKTAIDLNPSAINSYIFLTKLYLIIGQVDMARTLISEINDVEMDYCKSDIELNDKNYDKAISILENSSHNLTVNHEAYTPKQLHLALIYYVMNDREQANVYFQEARLILEEKLDEQQYDSRIFSSLGIVYAGLGMREKAIEANDKAIQIMNISIDALRGVHRELDMARILMMLGDHDKAIEKLEFLLQINSFLSVELLKNDPFWNPLRQITAFKTLISNPEYQIN